MRGGVRLFLARRQFVSNVCVCGVDVIYDCHYVLAAAHLLTAYGYLIWLPFDANGIQHTESDREHNAHLFT